MTRRVPTLFAVTFVIAGAASMTNAAGPNISAGEWELSMRMQMDGAPIKMPALTFKTCLSESNPVPQQPQRGPTSCEVRDQKLVGDKATWTVVCKDAKSTMETRGTGTYRGTTMEATQTTTITDGRGRTQTMKHEMTGKRIGACPAGKP